MPHACGYNCLRIASALRSSGFVPFVPCTHSRPFTQLHSLREWTPGPTKKLSTRCQSAVAERATAVDTAVFLQVLQARQPKRFSPDLLDGEGRLMLKNLTKSELLQWVELQGERPQRARHLWRWMYYKDHWIQSLSDTQGQHNGFGSAFTDHFNANATVDGGLQLQSTHTASDGTCKMLFKLKGQQVAGLIETVLIPVAPHGKQRPRTTLCVSSQVGCAMNCQFCYTGRMGLRAQLSTAQIVEQVIEALRHVSSQSSDSRSTALLPPITNIVFMGMGEPLHNLAAVMSAVDILCDPTGLQFSHNKVTVSTVGLVPQLRHFVKNSKAQLAVSLHATTDAVRKEIVPVNRKWPLESLITALQDLFPRSSSRNSHARHVLIEYVMLAGVNDSLEDAHRLVQLMQGVECKINLIVFNPHTGTRFTASPMEQVEAFRAIIVEAQRVCTIRDSRGDDEMAACGQLGSLELAANS